MKLLLVSIFIALPLLILGAPVLLAISAIQEEPLVVDTGSMRHADVARLKTLLEQHDPRKLQDGETRRLQVTERDLNLMLNSALP